MVGIADDEDVWNNSQIEHDITKMSYLGGSMDETIELNMDNI